MRLIDADAYLEKVKRQSRFHDVKGTYDLDEMPTIDAVPVVRCKDCEFFEPVCMEIGACKVHSCDTEDDVFMKENDFCSYGERKTDA